MDHQLKKRKTSFRRKRMFSNGGIAMELHETHGYNLVFEWDMCFPMGNSKILEPAFFILYLGSLIGFIAEFFEVKGVK